MILLRKYLPLWLPENFVKIAIKPLFQEIYAENGIMARNQNPFGIDAAHKIPRPLVTRKFRQKRRETIISR